MPYSSFQVSPSPNRSYLTMSSSGAEHTAAAHSPGCWVIVAPTSRPPLEPPETASWPAVVQRSAISWRPAAAKSSNTFCLRSRIPARCHCSPSSLPPRRLAMA